MHLRELFIEPSAHIAPARALEGVSGGDAERRIPGATHSIAELVAHMTFWLDWFTRRCEGEPVPVVARAADGWPDVPRGSWPAVRDRFLAALERAAALSPRARRDDPISPPLEFEPLAHYRVRDAVVHMSNHTAHHLGQVILLRQLLGIWPPPGGGWTW